jgi:hypothetical protein
MFLFFLSAGGNKELAELRGELPSVYLSTRSAAISSFLLLLAIAQTDLQAIQGSSFTSFHPAPSLQATTYFAMYTMPAYKRQYNATQ